MRQYDPIDGGVGQLLDELPAQAAEAPVYTYRQYRQVF
jgi:hypothetical protein